jgi:GntR family transcriptional repressor for pyruvate dehydrogenase complex
LALLARAIEGMRDAQGPYAFVEADVEFHEALALAGGNRVLAAFLRSLRPLLLKGMLIGTALAGARDVAVREHTAIYEAVRGQDTRAARRLMEAHLRRSYDEWAEAGYVNPDALAREA